MPNIDDVDNELLATDGKNCGRECVCKSQRFVRKLLGEGNMTYTII